MKLLSKTTLYFLFAMIILLAGAGYYLFLRFSDELNRRSDKELISQEIQWIRYVQNQEENGTSVIIKAPDLSLFPVDAQPAEYPTLRNIDLFSEKTHSGIPYRQLSQVVSVNGVSYLILLRQSQEQKAALVTDITRIMLFVFIGLFIVTLVFNWIISARLWAPFRRSLKKIRSAELQQMEAVHFEETNTQEFNELNAALNVMTGKIYRDYMNMKEFTETAAHEMQTPIAVVQSKLELLLQDTNLTDEQLGYIVQSTTALTRLSKLNGGLLLLAKIENNQYHATGEVNLTAVIRKYIALFDALIRDKNLTVSTAFESEFFVLLHPFLADTLVSNLVGNAIKYNYSGGTIHISTHQHRFSIRNTSHEPEIEGNQIFTRMHRNLNMDEQSNGLGLAIVKKIADNNNLTIQYRAEENVHEFCLLSL